MSSSNETRKPTGRPSLLSAEQQTALEQHQPAPAAAVPQAGEAPRRKHVWLVGGLSLLAIGAAFAVVQFGQGEAEAPAAMLAAAPAQVTAPATANPQANAPVPAPAPAAAPAADATVPPPQADGAAPPVAPGSPAQAVATIIDEAPPGAAAKPKESLAQMLESGAPPAAKPAPAKPVRKVAKERPAKVSDRALAVAAPEQDTDVELLAALVAHAKFDATSANARVPLPKALEQCKKQGKQDAARCRIRVCEGRWKKAECRVYSRSKLEKAASGA